MPVRIHPDGLQRFSSSRPALRSALMPVLLAQDDEDAFLHVQQAYLEAKKELQVAEAKVKQ